jgi:hypothetical protein
MIKLKKNKEEKNKCNCNGLKNQKVGPLDLGRRRAHGSP